MIIPIILLILAAWAGFLGTIASCMVGNAAGIFWYSIIAMVAGTGAKLLIRKSL